MSAINFTAQRGLSLLGDEAGAWMADTTAETLVGSELVTNGDFPTDTSGWTDVSATLSVVSAKLRITNTGTNGRAYQSFTTVIGKTYQLIFDTGAVSSAAQRVYVSIDTSTTNAIESLDASASTASNNFSFVATTTTTYVLLFALGAAAATADYDNISVRIADPDLSTADNGLGVHGSITKTAVNTGADLMGYSGFSASNYLEQPYNADLDFGTGDFTLGCWMKSSSTGIDYAINRGEDNANNPRVGIYGSSDDEIGLGINGGASSFDTGIFTSDDYKLVIFTRISGVIYGYIDGALMVSSANTTDLTNTSASLFVGCLRPANNVYGGSVALVRAIDYGLTAAQIKTIYDKEKHLFKKHSYYTQEGVSYDLDIQQMTPRPTVETTKAMTKTRSGKVRSIVHHDDNTWEIQTSLIHRTDGTTYLRKSEFVELMFSTNGSEQFNYDPYGTVAVPDEPITVQRSSNQYQLTPEENTEFFRSSFTVREVTE